MVIINSPQKGVSILKIRILLHPCFKNCEYKTNIYENFKSHKYIKHCDTVNVFKPGIDFVEKSCGSVASDISDGESIESSVNVDTAFDNGDSENLEKDIELKIASVLLKLENIMLCLMQL